MISHQQERFRALSPRVEVVATESEALWRLSGRLTAYDAVVAPVRATDGREIGYRLARTLRGDLGVACPILLYSDWVTPSSRAFAMQCGATRLLVDDLHLVADLVDLLAGADAAAV